jgi:hypothetical protein
VSRVAALLDRYLALPELSPTVLRAGFSLSLPELGLDVGTLDAFWLTSTWLEAFALLGTGVTSARCTPWEEGVVDLEVLQEEIRIEHRHASGKLLGTAELDTYELGAAFLGPVQTFGALMDGLSAEVDRRLPRAEDHVVARLEAVKENVALRPGLLDGALLTLRRWTAN